MRSSASRGQLYLDDQYVGDVNVRGWEGAWGMGEFTPAPAFAAFAPRFGEWSRLMHCREASRRLPRAIAQQLRRVETDLYRIQARIYHTAEKQWRTIAILTIDGQLIEWKESWSPQQPVGAARATAGTGSVEAWRDLG